VKTGVFLLSLASLVGATDDKLLLLNGHLLALPTYLRDMKRLRTYSLLLAASAALFLTAACSVAPDAEKDPSADAAYKREHRTEGYREAQRSNTNY
jgi:hypothetical protein